MRTLSAWGGLLCRRSPFHSLVAGRGVTVTALCLSLATFEPRVPRTFINFFDADGRHRPVLPSFPPSSLADALRVRPCCRDKYERDDENGFSPRITGRRFSLAHDSHGSMIGSTCALALAIKPCWPRYCRYRVNYHDRRTR